VSAAAYGAGTAKSALPAREQGDDMSRTWKAAWFSVLLLAFATGCSNTLAQEARFAQTEHKFANGPVEAPPKPAESGAKAAAAPPPGDCELRLYVEQAPSRGYYGVDQGHLGVAVVERSGTRLIDGVCVKRQGVPLELPATILIASPDDDALDRFCFGTSEKSKIGSQEVFACKWNGRFHASRPFSFTLVAAGTQQVGDFVEFLRVYRNGDLMAAWNRASDQPDRSRVVIEGNPLRSGFWAATLPPHLAAMDLRIIPRGTPIPDAVNLTVRNDAERSRERVTQALVAAADEALPKESPARKSLECMKIAVLHAHDQVLKIVRGEIGMPSLDPKCEMPLGLEYGTPLSDAYKDEKNRTREKLVEYKNKAEEALQQAPKALEAKLPPKVQEILRDGAERLLAAHPALKAKIDRARGAQDLVEFLKLGAPIVGLDAEEAEKLKKLYESSQALVKDLDKQVTVALRIVDEARALSIELFEEASRIGSDPNRQAQIFNAFAESLRDQGDVFEARRDNPALLAGEQKIPMEYSDKWQAFALAPWNGVPIRTNDAEADLNAAVAIPLVDAMGVRYQWGKTRFADARLAIGGGYTSTERVYEDGSKVAKAAFLPNISLGLGTFKIGVGVVTVKAGSKPHDQVRVIVGADLLKLVTGSNVEAL
jgi:hypothetical protein